MSGKLLIFAAYSLGGRMSYNSQQQHHKQESFDHQQAQQNPFQPKLVIPNNSNCYVANKSYRIPAYFVNHYELSIGVTYEHSVFANDLIILEEKCIHEMIQLIPVINEISNEIMKRACLYLIRYMQNIHNIITNCTIIHKNKVQYQLVQLFNSKY